ncbi:MAG: methyltransferase domain-containing protein [Nostocaceae cyanobacterium]|nr:methyltransferase domain-containing protein [Nostocaceae cyanobacterium]
MNFFKQKNNLRFLDSIPASSRETERWDKEWIAYFNTEDPRPFLKDYQRLTQNKQVIENIKQFSEEEILNTCICEELPALRIWIPGKDLAGKRVLEIGCGPGFLGKQIGLIAKKYVGIDYSNLALSIAKLVSPANCDYLHISDRKKIVDYVDSIDTMVGRFFFIHQNFSNSIWVLKLVHLLLKPGGVISADFYKATPDIQQGVVFPAKHALSQNYPSCAFEYTESEIKELATHSGLKIVNMHRHTEMQRLFVCFEK